MIDFACNQFNLKDIVKCELGLTKSELKIFEFFIKNYPKSFDTSTISRKTKLNLTTIQKAVKKLYTQKIILRQQKNLFNGGYNYIYVCNSKIKIKKILKEIVHNWAKHVENYIEHWEFLND